MQSLFNQLKQVLRRLGRAPMFTAVTFPPGSWPPRFSPATCPAAVDPVEALRAE